MCEVSNGHEVGGVGGGGAGQGPEANVPNANLREVSNYYFSR